MDFDIVKAGWLFRLSSILKRWKRCWFVLHRDGLLKYYSSQEQNTADGVVSMTLECSDVKSEIRDVNPPPHLGIECLFSVATYEGNTWFMCAESLDDKKAWEMSLNDARLQPVVRPPPPYVNMEPPPGYYANQVQTYVPGYQYQYQYPQHQTTVIYTDQPYHYRRATDGTDVAMGVVAGAALGSLMWGPLLWW